MITNNATSCSTIANGISKDYVITFSFLSSSDIRVRTISKDGIVAELNPGTSYSINGNVLTTVSAIAQGSSVIIYRETAKIQSLSLSNSRAINANAIENALDRLTMVEQELAREGYNSIRVSDGNVNCILPSADKRANGVVSFSEDGMSVQITAKEELIKALNSFDNFPSVGDSSLLYIDSSLNAIYRWDDVSHTYINISISTVDGGLINGE